MQYQVLTVGNPNSGKTTLFNGLTGAKQQVGNWAGVTVEKKTGQFKHAGDEFLLTNCRAFTLWIAVTIVTVSMNPSLLVRC